MSASDYQLMEPAPTLPPVLGAVPRATPHSTQSAAPAPTGMDSAMAMTEDAVPGPASELRAVIARTQELGRQLARAHQEYLDSSARLHGHFQALRNEHNRALLRAASLSAPLPRPAEPTERLEPAPVRPPPEPSRTPAHPGPKLGQAELVIHGAGQISSIFGPEFARQDQHRHQIRVAKPPLLLMDRITGIEGTPGTTSKGRIWSEQDLQDGSWYLNDCGQMSISILIEAGQANTLLMSWLGADWLHQGDHVYRLLGVDCTVYNSLPAAGDTLCVEIHVEGSARLGDSHIFFLVVHMYVEGQLRAFARMQSGLFLAEELKRAGSLTWDPARDKRTLEEPLAAPFRLCKSTSFSPEQVRAFAAGRPRDCFGPGFERTNAHVRTPKIAADRMQMIDEVTAFEPGGGPWGRGYLRSIAQVAPRSWCMDAHFHGDPCMPGFLMLEGALQSMSFYLAALGFTIEHDGWRFEPVTEKEYPLRWRGQVTPENKCLTYEVFVESLSTSPTPTLVADVVMSADGRHSFHAQRLRLRLVPDYPLESWQRQGPPVQQETGEPVPLSRLGGLVGYRQRPVASADGMAFDYPTMLTMCWGRPTRVLGPAYARFDGELRMSRLPGPPFLFISRVVELHAVSGQLKPGSALLAEYDVPERVWFFEQQPAPVAPFAVLLEAMLQSCGWLSVFAVGPNHKALDGRQMYRNLEGTVTVYAEVGPQTGAVRSRVTMLSSATLGSMNLLKFTVECRAGESLLAKVETDFGFFPPEAFLAQTGLPPTPAERERFAAPGHFLVDLTSRPARYFAGPLRLPGPMLLMLQQVDEYIPDGGRAGLGYLRAHKDIDPGEWFFKAHFFQDPVQPGSLGLEAMCQLLQFYMIERELHADIPEPRFECLMLERPMTWKYRGQVVPENRCVGIELEVIEVGGDEKGPFAVADCWLWVDGLRVYQAKNLGLRVVSAAR